MATSFKYFGRSYPAAFVDEGLAHDLWSGIQGGADPSLVD
jgi:hypothetical protein